MNKKARGYGGERLAVEYLSQKGYEIVSRNEKIAGVEIDIIAKEEDVFIFCEVKTRESEEYGLGIEGVSKTQMQRYIRAAKLFLATRGRGEYSVRFDVIEILRDKINHVEDAFQG